MKDIPFKVVESRQIYDRQVEGLSIIETSYAVVVLYAKVSQILDILWE